MHSKTQIIQFNQLDTLFHLLSTHECIGSSVLVVKVQNSCQVLSIIILSTLFHLFYLTTKGLTIIYSQFLRVESNTFVISTIVFAFFQVGQHHYFHFYLERLRSVSQIEVTHSPHIIHISFTNEVLLFIMLIIISQQLIFVFNVRIVGQHVTTK